MTHRERALLLQLSAAVTDLMVRLAPLAGSARREIEQQAAKLIELHDTIVVEGIGPDDLPLLTGKDS